MGSLKDRIEPGSTGGRSAPSPTVPPDVEAHEMVQEFERIFGEPESAEKARSTPSPRDEFAIEFPDDSAQAAKTSPTGEATAAPGLCHKPVLVTPVPRAAAEASETRFARARRKSTTTFLAVAAALVIGTLGGFYAAKRMGVADSIPKAEAPASASASLRFDYELKELPAKVPRRSR